MSAPAISGTAFDVSVPIPELVVTPDHTHVFMFSAATWNRHAIHYDKNAAVAEGFEDVVVQRGLIGNYLARLLATWLGSHGEIRGLSWKVTRSVYPGTTLRCRARVTSVAPMEGARSVACELDVVNRDEQAVASGNARVIVYG